MEEIDVVKKSSLAWLWILLAIAAAAILLWAVIGGNHTNSATGLRLDPAAPRVVAHVLTV